MRKRLLLICLGIAMCLPAVAQRKIVATEQFSDYNRNSISAMETRYGDRFDDVFIKTVSDFSVGRKFDKNELKTKFIRIPVPRRMKNDEKISLSNHFTPDPSFASYILTDLNELNVGKEIFQFVLKPDAEGRFSRELIDERGLWNADDKDFEEAQMTQVDAMGQDGEKLIAKSFIIVYDMQNPHQQEVKSVDKNGKEVKKYIWIAEVNAFVYKIANADNLISLVLNDMWIYDTDDAATKASKKKAFDDLHVDLEFVNSVGVRVSNEDLGVAISYANDNLTYQLEKRIEEWQVAIDCETVKPFITAKVGKKEGVRNGSRFGIYGQVYNSKKERLEFKRKGYVRATEVADNMKVADGKADSTYFYRISGGATLRGNEILKQRNDLGLSVYANGNLNGSLSAPSSKTPLFGSFAIGNAGFDYLMSINRKGRSSYIILEAGYDMKSGSNIEKGCKEFGKYGQMIDDEGKNYFEKGVSFFNVSLGYAYGLRIKQVFELQGFIKVGWDMMGADVDQNKLQKLAEKIGYTPKKAIDEKNAKQRSSLFVDPGVRMIFNIVYPVQLFAQANYSVNIYSTDAYKIINTYLKDCGCGHGNGLGVGAGVRVCF